MIEQSAPAPDQGLGGESTVVPRLSGAWLRVAKLIWWVLLPTALAILLTSLPGYIQIFGGVLPHIGNRSATTGAAIIGMFSGLASLASALLSLTLAILFYRRRFTEPLVAALAFYLLLYAVVMAGPLESWATYWLGASTFALHLQGLLIGLPTVGLLALFPNGRFVPGWTRWLLLLSFLWSLVWLLSPILDSVMLTQGGSIPLIFFAGGLIIQFGIVFLAQFYRYRHVSTPDEQRQAKWVVYGFALWLIYILLSSIPYYYLTSLPPGSPVPWWTEASILGWFLSLNIMPISLTIAVTRYRLGDIDIIINRTLVYGVLTALIVGLYALVVGAMGTLFQTQGNWFVALIATGLVAVLFQPLRDRLQQGVNRLLYGHRDEPLEVLTRLGQRLEDALPPEQVLPSLVETITQTLKLPYAAINMKQGDLEQTAASYGKPIANPRTFPLTFQGVIIGHLLAAPRSAEETFTPAEERLLQNIARQAGTAVHTLQLTAALQHARQQIVTSREEERRRLRRDLHDGLGPSLAAQLLKIGSARALLQDRPQLTDQLLVEMERDIETTLADVRRIVYDLRPPALDQWGLVRALRAYAESCASDTLEVRMDAPQSLPPLPAAVEVAAYHIGREGLTNVVRHAQARHSTLKVWLDGEGQSHLHLSIHDDGRGFSSSNRAGVGFAAMRERAAELSGTCTIFSDPGKGTVVTAVLPMHTGG